MLSVEKNTKISKTDSTWVKDEYANFERLVDLRSLQFGRYKGFRIDDVYHGDHGYYKQLIELIPSSYMPNVMLYNERHGTILPRQQTIDQLKLM